MSVSQPCPACQADADVSLFSPGQRIRCGACGHRFDVTVDVPSPPPVAPEVAPPVGAPPPEAVEAAAERLVVQAEDAPPSPGPIPRRRPHRGRWLGAGLGLAVGGAVWGWTGLGFTGAGVAPGPTPAEGDVGREVSSGARGRVLPLPLAARRDGDPCERRFDFSRAAVGEWSWVAWRGDWAWTEGALVAVPAEGDPAAPEPRAFLGAERYLPEGLAVEATVGVDDPEPTGWAALYLYRNRTRYLGVVSSAGDGQRLVWRQGQVQGELPLPAPDPVDGPTTRRLSLRVEGGVVRAWVDDGDPVAVSLGPFGEDDWGKVGLGCAAARCRFQSLRLEGRSRPAPERGD